MDRISVYRTRTRDTSVIFDQLGELYNKILHVVASKRTIKLESLKNDIVSQYQIPSRWFDTIRVDLEGRIESIKECLKLNKNEKEETIKKIEEQIKKLKNKEKNLLKIIYRSSLEREDLKKIQVQLFRKRYKLDVLTRKLVKIKQQLSYAIPSICFGTKALFKKQHNSENFLEWKKDWQFARNNQFYSIGSKDTNNGNLCCTPTIQEDGRISIRILIPKCLRTTEKYHYVKDLYFKNGHDQICKAINAHKLGNGEATSFRFIKDHKSWQIFATIHEVIPEITIKDGGYIGVDLNDGFLACAVVMKNGNLMNRKEGIFSIPMNLKGKSSDQSTAIIGDVVKELINKAKYYNIPICVEKLDFSKKKQALKNKTSKKQRTMLSSFAYKKFYSILVSACHKAGVELKTVNPAFTSLLGRNKFMKMYGLSVHHAAAMCIARRGMELSEDIISGEFLNDSGTLITCNLPERMNYDNDFSYLKAVQSILKKNLKVIGYKSRRKTGIAARCLSDGNSHNLLGAGKSVDLTEILRYV